MEKRRGGGVGGEEIRVVTDIRRTSILGGCNFFEKGFL
jgi:hypothetical protein